MIRRAAPSRQGAGVSGGGPEPRRRAGRVPGTASRTAIRLHVRRLVLEGVARADRGRVVSAMAAHLAELIERAPAFDWSRAASRGRVDGGTVSSQATPDEIGRHVARQIFTGVMRRG